MRSDDPWIEARLAEALRLHGPLNEVVLARLEALLKGKFSESQLSQTELSTIATALIADMVPASPNATTKE